MTRAEFAEKLGVSPQAVSNWVAEDPKNRTRPSGHLRKEIERIAGIPRATWLTDEEREAAGIDAPKTKRGAAA